MKFFNFYVFTFLLFSIFTFKVRENDQNIAYNELIANIEVPIATLVAPVQSVVTAYVTVSVTGHGATSLLRTFA